METIGDDIFQMKPWLGGRDYTVVLAEIFFYYTEITY